MCGLRAGSITAQCIGSQMEAKRAHKLSMVSMSGTLMLGVLLRMMEYCPMEAPKKRYIAFRAHVPTTKTPTLL